MQGEVVETRPHASSLKGYAEQTKVSIRQWDTSMPQKACPCLRVDQRLEYSSTDWPFNVCSFEQQALLLFLRYLITF